MSGSPSLGLAFAAGFVSFVSPCTLPLVPGYLAMIAGPNASARRTAARSAVFVGTFSVTFVILGLSATTLGSLLLRNQQLLTRVAGVVILTMGLILVGSVFTLRLNRTFRVAAFSRRAGTGGPAVAGLAFALAWTPCIGPTLGAILGLAALSSTTPQAAALLAVYAAGMAIPFLLSAVAFDRLQGGFAFFRRHARAVQIGSGVLLVVMGLLVLTDSLTWLNVQARHALDGIGIDLYGRL